ncbi:pyruvate kinase [Candidatus Saccharibacteria bacterium]|nr:pyruvate kinase [Candidatus Saccharibacteria bacterium]
MSVTNQAPKVPLDQFKRTKIIATVGPASNDYQSIYEMIVAGANGIRLNFSHGTEEERKQHIEWVRRASETYAKPVAIIQDLQGPKIRLGDFDGIINVRSGKSLQFKYKSDYERTGIIPTQYDLSKKVKRGERLFLVDGKIRTQITSVKDGVVHVRAENDGILTKKKGINLPDTDLGGDILTKKDKEDITFGVEQKLDYVALSFVQSGSDIEHLRRILNNLGSKAKIIAKIETKAAIENIEEIFEQADATMIARGDLAIETLPESVPVDQRNIIGLGLRYKKPTIVATQMLASMTEALEPTRAEVSDVATAVIVGADCVMLSDETASGRYPVESVKVMKRVIMYTQSKSTVEARFPEHENTTRQHAISSAIIKLAKELQANAIIAATKSGATAKQIASFRPKVPIIAVTSDEVLTRQLAIIYGTKSYTRPVDRLAATKMTNWLLSKNVLKKDDIVITASGKYPGVVGATDTIKVRVL